MSKTTCVLIGLALAFSRISIGISMEPESFSWLDAYKDVAHLFMGGLAVAWWIQRLSWQWWLFWLLNAVEVATAVLSRVL